jgi:signal transduction histidine kinase
MGLELSLADMFVRKSLSLSSKLCRPALQNDRTHCLLSGDSAGVRMQVLSLPYPGADVESIEGCGGILNTKEITYSNAQSRDVQVARLEMLLKISRALNSTHELNALLQSITEVATELTETEAASILLLDKKTGELYFEAATGEKQADIERIVVPLKGSIAGWVALNGQPLVIDKAEEDNRHYREVDRLLSFETRSILGVPLKVKNETIGVLEVLNKHHDAGFTGDDVYTLNTLASQAAVAIENARLFEQSDQLADVIHEMRSPLASIVGFSQLLLIKPNPSKEEIRGGLESINREATRLSQMINDFLDLTQLESGRIRMENKGVNLHTLAQEVVELFYPQTLEENISLSLKADTHIPDIIGDANRLKQVIVNLVDNAIKYVPTGGEVEVILACNDVRVRLSVRDSGSGIAPDDLELIFNKFYRVEGDEDGVTGSGLGLPIAKKIIEAHGGDIWVESEAEVGSTFSFSLPLPDQ